jgi:hypothetical protein
MRQLTILSIVLLLAAMAFGQSTATVITGYASNWGPQAVYAVPFVPLVTTPSVQLGVPPLAVGASNATAGLATGASTSTVSMESPMVSTVFPRPVWYGVVAQAVATEEAGSAAEAASPGARGFDPGLATIEGSHSIAPLAAQARGHKHASRSYTNGDVDHVNLNNGMIKRGGKQ